MSKTEKIPVIKSWRMQFVDGTPITLREKSQSEIIRFARGAFGNGILNVVPCYSLVGHIYGGDYPEGHEVITHEITSLTNISHSSLAKTISANGEPVLIAKTRRDEEYYLVIEHIDILV